MILQTASAAPTWIEQLLGQGVVGVLSILCVAAVIAMWKYAATISARVEQVTDRFIGYLEAQAKQDSIEAERRVAAELKVADTIERVGAQIMEHEKAEERRHEELLRRMVG